MTMMTPRTWRAQAPSNIALIKYMGKTDAVANRPTNTSLSYTLPFLRSVVELELSSGAHDSWEPLARFEDRRLAPFEMSEKGRAKFLAHLGRIKKQFDVEGGFVIRSANDFASDCGLASSASSFAALTMAALAAAAEISGRAAPSVEQAAEISRQGSGSSCRSFFTPWALWESHGARAVPELAGRFFLHQAVVVSSDRKEVSSSEAHVRVSSSRLFAGRPERAEERARELIKALATADWRTAFEISWAEFWDMHALFETSRPSFGYMNDESLRVLRWVRAQTWDNGVRGPIVTMDAGPNIHLLHIDDEAGRAFAGEVRRKFGAHVLTSGELAP